MRTLRRLSLGLIAVMALFGCSGTKPDAIGLSNDRLAPCSSRPNCVASNAEDADHRIEPFRFDGDPTGIWGTLKTVLADLPRTEIVTADERYIHAEAKSRLFGFVDDVEFHLRPDDGLIAIRSAARIGYSDMGVNAARIEAIRLQLRAKGLLL